MSKIKVQQPIIHTPAFKVWETPRSCVDQIIRNLGLDPLYTNGVHKSYFYTDNEGRAQLLPHLIQKSSLYKPSAFTCIQYAFKVWTLCGEIYGLNTWVPIIGRIPNYETGKHAWTLIMVGDKDGLKPGEFNYFEPNEGWEMGETLELVYQSFPIGAEGYTGELIFY